MVVVVLGVSGSGKSTIGTMLAKAMSCSFLEGDELHPPANIAKMTSGTPLTDDDRWPWLTALHSRMVNLVRRGQCVVAACSALKREYRQMLATGLPISWVYLDASEDLVRSRLSRRTGHFMKPNMLESQFDTVEEPEDAIVVDASQTPDVIVGQLLTLLDNAVDVRVYSNGHELSFAVARAVSQLINDRVSAKGQCSLALSGGDTPRELYGILASALRDQIPWERVHVFWGDERYVHHDQPDSNFRMVKEVLLDHVPLRAGHIHPVPTHLPSLEIAAQNYEHTLRQYFGSNGPAFDLNLLGIGTDGHTASIFPGSAALTDHRHWVVGAETHADPPKRVTLTLPALMESANLYVVVAGSLKAPALRHVLTATADPSTYPAAGLHRSRGKLTWWADHDATSDLTVPAQGL